jgi:protein TonB
VTARAVLASAALHIATAVIIAMLVAAATGVRQPSTVDIELVGPATVALGPAPMPPPPLKPGRDPGRRGDRIADRAPARRARPVRKLPDTTRAAPPAPPPAAVVPDGSAPAVAEPAPTDTADVGSREPAGGEALRSGGGPGEGAGGRGGGDSVLDLSARPVPLEVHASQTLMSTAEAQRDRISGYVHLVLTVDPLGHVGRATVRQGLGHGLDEIATKHAMQIRFRPARDRAGNPTGGTVRWRFYFEPQ